jgi:hypothetical protein
MAVTLLGYAETAAILRRKLNQGVLTAPLFNKARLFLRQEVLLPSDFDLLAVENADILASYLRCARALPPRAPTPVLVASDQRLLRAARLEGLQILNPEQVPAADVPAFLAAL